MSIPKNWRNQFTKMTRAQLDAIIARAPLACIWQTCSHVSSGNWAEGCLAVQERKCREIAQGLVPKQTGGRMSVTNASPIADRREFKRARQEAGMTAWEVDIAAGYPRGTCANFEFQKRELTELEVPRLFAFLQVLVAKDCEPKTDYRTAILEYRLKHNATRVDLAKRTGVSEWAIRNLEFGANKRGPLARTREKLDAVLFDA